MQKFKKCIASAKIKNCNHNGGNTKKFAIPVQKKKITFPIPKIKKIALPTQKVKKDCIHNGGYKKLQSVPDRATYLCIIYVLESTRCAGTF